MPASKRPAAFLSYAHSDDHYGDVTTFRERASHEIAVQLGEDFPIFQDKEHLLLGEKWEERIADTLLRDVTFLIPILTPRFFNSRQCRAEVERFLKREREYGRVDLILPVYYVNASVLHEEAELVADPIAREMSKRQWIDWRELRFEPYTSPRVARTLERMAKHVLEATRRKKTAAQPHPSPLEVTPAKSSSKNEPPTHFVDPIPNRADFETIGRAIVEAQPGDRIVVRRGLYREGLVIEKPLEIIGEGSLGDVVVEATGCHLLSFRSTMGRIANLTLRQIGGRGWYGVDIGQGRLELEGCDITSSNFSCVAIHDGADPLLRRNRIHHSKHSGVFVYENGLGTLEENDIFDNAGVGIQIWKQGNPVLRRNKINNNGYWAVWIYDAGAGTIDGNDLRDNFRGALSISEDSKANVKLSNNRES